MQDILNTEHYELTETLVIRMQELPYTFNKNLTNNFRETTEEKEAILNNFMPLKILSKVLSCPDSTKALKGRMKGLNDNLWMIVLTL